MAFSNVYAFIPKGLKKLKMKVSEILDELGREKQSKPIEKSGSD